MNRNNKKIQLLRFKNILIKKSKKFEYYITKFTINY